MKKLFLVCTSTGFGGLEMNTLLLVDWLKEYGWETHLLLSETTRMYEVASASGRHISTVQSFDRNASRANSTILKSWLGNAAQPILFAPYNKDIKALAAYKRFRNKNARIVYQQHMQVGVAKRDFIHTVRYSMIDLWISPLEYLRQETIQKTRVKPAKISVIPFGLDADRFLTTTITFEQARAALNLPVKALLVGVLGRVDPKKGQDFLVRAIAALRDDYGLEIHLLIMGGKTVNVANDYFEKLQLLVKENSLEAQVHFRDFNADVNLFYQSIDVFGMPSHGETFGMVTLEAMLSRKPVIGVGKDGTLELLQDGKYGYLHELENVADFCRQFLALQANDQLGQMLDAARDYVLANFSKKKMCSLLNEALMKLG